MEININLDEHLINFVKEKSQGVDIKDKIYDIVKELIIYEQLENYTISVSIVSASEEEIHKINKEYRNVDRKTDVLSFPIFERTEIEDLKNVDELNKKLEQIELGDIIICENVVFEHSEEYRTGIIREMLYMIVHGMCHLLGYDHEEDDDKKIMRLVEETILEKVGV